ncbi:hypothetical protein [Nocardiopsis ganjiahuensis]|uniref:hypothetical protein n=1 Tax=Nocardiopsis ganjiahuensis TaxID=239984 RepID=UPI000344C161|nr:hypothetical protein [Nocardiopsis ganjiahuensis]
MSHNTATLSMADAAVPSLSAGRYRVTAEYGITTGNDPRQGSTQQEIQVTAPRFRLDPGLVARVYPPPSSTGSYDTVLPHATLSRLTLPWERGLGLMEESQPWPPPPWLALLLFDARELPDDPGAQGRTTRTTVREWLADTSCAVPNLQTTAEEGALTCQTVRIPTPLLRRVLPTPADLSYLAHVRTSSTPYSDGVSVLPQDCAVLVAGRLPAAPASGTVAQAAHLVSLEGVHTMAENLTSDSPVHVRLVSLHSWSFNCAPDTGPGFGAVLRELVGECRTTGGQFSAPPVSVPGTPEAETPRTGAVRVHLSPALLDDESGAPPCYGGPLQPRTGTRPASDLGYADARALGRTIALGRADILAAGQATQRTPSRAPRTHQEQFHTLLTSGAARDLGAALHTHRAVTKNPAPAPARPPAPPTAPAHSPADVTAAAELLAADLFQLRGVPFCHLVPDPRMLPAETLRFFHVDETWVQELITGAAEVSASSSGLRSTIEALTAATLQRGRTLTGLDTGADHRTGLLIRSQLVADWPTLHVNAGSAEGPVTVRRRALANDVLLCLFDSGSAVTWVELAEPAHGLHFGFTRGDDGLQTVVRGPDGEDTGQRVSLAPLMRSAHDRTLNLTALAAKACSEPAPTSSQLAVQLIRSPFRQYFGTPPQEQH